jgi:transcriptional regulator with XRE-family HTH domain
MRTPQIEIPKMSNLQASRLEAGLTPAELAARVGVHRTTIMRAETGKIQLSVHKFARIARALGTTIEELVEPELFELPGQTTILRDGQTARRVPAAQQVRIE